MRSRWFAQYFAVNRLRHTKLSLNWHLIEVLYCEPEQPVQYVSLKSLHKININEINIQTFLWPVKTEWEQFITSEDGYFDIRPMRMQNFQRFKGRPVVPGTVLRLGDFGCTFYSIRTFLEAQFISYKRRTIFIRG